MTHPTDADAATAAGGTVPVRSPASPPDFRAVFEASPSVDLLLAPDLTVVAASDAYLRASLMARDALVGRHLFDVFPGDPSDPAAAPAADVRASLARVLATRAPDTVAAQRYAVRRPAGQGGGFEERCWSITHTPILGADGAVEHILHRVDDATGLARKGDGQKAALVNGAPPVDASAFLRASERLGPIEYVSTVAPDVTERNRDEDALRRREQEFRTLAENIPALVARFDRELRHLYVNRQVAAATGLPASAFLGKTNRDLGMPEELCAPVDAQVRHVFATGQATTLEFVYPSPAGPRCFHSWLGPELSASGSVETVCAITRDVTEQKELEKELRRRMEELAAADRRKDEFLATLAHELRNPLAPLRNGLELLRLGASDPAASERARAMMERQVAHMVRLIDDLLDVSRITRGKLRLRRERVELASVVQSAIEASRPLIDASRHALTVDVPPGPIHLDVDPTRLAQVLSNLLTNAAKYTDPGGRIRLSVERQGGEVVIAVRDTGIGIAAEHVPGLFQMFSQVSPALERSQGGLGIGLSLVRGLVELHGGRVAARSDGPGKGSEFSVRLPLAEERAPAAPPPGEAREASPSPSRCRVLVVDDNSDAADSLAMLLRVLGYAIEIAYDGRQAAEVAARFRPDVALLDIGLPKMNGYEVARYLREQPWGKELVLVALTGWGQQEDKQRATEAGFDVHLTKPVDPGAIKALLADLDERRRAPAHPAPPRSP
ncbi:hybrid sensor histidine kinase/response regulator [Sorangium sp. So ce131]|uniref:hybrid sensor histidine kinase/response regulator n=1 Tax=Sorangium sp. So ce131 TaxID=3133282 RepID=UPI003F5E8339